MVAKLRIRAISQTVSLTGGCGGRGGEASTTKHGTQTPDGATQIEYNLTNPGILQPRTTYHIESMRYSRFGFFETVVVEYDSPSPASAPKPMISSSPISKEKHRLCPGKTGVDACGALLAPRKQKKQMETCPISNAVSGFLGTRGSVNPTLRAGDN